MNLYLDSLVIFESQALILGYVKIAVGVKPEVLPGEFKPKFLIVNSEELFDSLLGMLASGNVEVAGEAWKLLEELPKSRFYVDRLGELRLGTEDWDEFLRLKGGNEAGKVAYTVYTLAHILDGLIADNSKDKFAEYAKRFRAAKGFAFLLEVLSANIVHPQSKIQWKSLNCSLRAVNSFLQHESATLSDLFPSQKSLLTTWNDINNILASVYHSETESPILSQKEVCEIIDSCSRFHLRISVLEPQFSGKLAAAAYFAHFSKG